MDAVFAPEPADSVFCAVPDPDAADSRCQFGIYLLPLSTKIRSRPMEHLLQWLRRYVSPVFLALLVASFILWYIAKLSYTYTTEQTVRLSIDGQRIEVTCVVEGLGTNLFGYRVYMNKTLRIPLSELKTQRSHETGHEGKLIIDPQSLQNALAPRFSDIKIISIGDIPEIDIPEAKS